MTAGSELGIARSNLGGLPCFWRHVHGFQGDYESSFRLVSHFLGSWGNPVVSTRDCVASSIISRARLTPPKRALAYSSTALKIV